MPKIGNAHLPHQVNSKRLQTRGKRKPSIYHPKVNMHRRADCLFATPGLDNPRVIQDFIVMCRLNGVPPNLRCLIVLRFGPEVVSKSTISRKTFLKRWGLLVGECMSRNIIEVTFKGVPASWHGISSLLTKSEHDTTVTILLLLSSVWIKRTFASSRFLPPKCGRLQPDVRHNIIL